MESKLETTRARVNAERSGCSSEPSCSAFTVDDAINGLKHLADDHECCRPFVVATIAKLEQLQDAVRIALWIRDKLAEKERWGHDFEEWKDIERAITPNAPHERTPEK